jgi:hypothetical protein
MSFLFQFPALPRAEPSIAEEHALPQLPDLLSTTAGDAQNPRTNGLSTSQRHAQVVQGLRSSLPLADRWLNSGDVKLISRHPIAAGGSADIWEATREGHKVVLKSYRCYERSDVAQVSEVCCDYHLSREYLLKPHRGLVTRSAHGTSFATEAWTQSRWWGCTPLKYTLSVLSMNVWMVST